MNLKDYATALLTDYKKPDFAAEDPYQPILGTYQGVNKEIQSAATNPNYSLQDKLSAALLTGLFGGGIAGLSEDYQSRAKQSYIDVASGMGDAEDQDLLSTKLFDSASDVPALFAVEKAKQAEAKAAEIEMLKLKMGIEHPYELAAYEKLEAAKRAPKPVAQSLDAKKLADAGIGVASIAGPSGEEAILGESGEIASLAALGEATKPKESVQDKLHRLRLGGLSQSGAEKVLEEERLKPEKTLEKAIVEADAARKEIAAKPAVLSLQNAATGISKIESLADIDSKSSDIPFTYALISGLDGGVVKEGEVAMIQGSNPLLTQMKGLLEGALNGKSALTPTIKRQMLNELKGTHNSLLTEAIRQSKGRLETAIARGVKNPKDALPFDPDYKYQLGGDKQIDPDPSDSVVEALTKINEQLNDPSLSYEAKQQLKQKALSLMPRPRTGPSGSPLG